MASDVKGAHALMPFSTMPNLNYKSKVNAPKNPKLIREPKRLQKVSPIWICQHACRIKKKVVLNIKAFAIDIHKRNVNGYKAEAGSNT
jgi:hypothetical protein